MSEATTIYRYIPHHHTQSKLSGKGPGPVKTTDQHSRAGAASRFNAWLAVKITAGVGTMWCAYAFAALALVSLPDALKAGKAAIIQWVAQTFLQLVLLSIIIVGQNVMQAASDKRAEATYDDADAVLHEAVKIQEHLLAQDKILDDLVRRATGSPA